MQTSRQIITELMAGRPAERMGLKDNIWEDTLEKWVTQGYPTDEKGNAIAPERHFGFDMIGCGEWFPWKARLIDDVLVDESPEWELVRDGNGATFKWWKKKSGTPEHFDFSMTSRKVWEEEYKPYVVGSVRERATPKAVEQVRTALADRETHHKWMDLGFRGLWENMRGAFGDIALYENMLLDPDWILDYCRAYTDLYLQEMRIVVDEAGQPDGAWFYDDLGYKGTTFCSPALYEKLIFPFYVELIGFCHEHDMTATLHTCGFTEPVLDLIVQVGFDAVNPLEVKAGNKILEIAERYGDRLMFVGGLDARILETHDRKLIETETKNLLQGMKERGGRFVFGSDHSISTIVNYDDFRFAVDVFHEHMAY